VASPATNPTAHRHSRKQSIPIPKGKWGPVIAQAEDPRSGIFAVFAHCGQAAGLMTILAVLRTAGDYKAGHPEETEIPEADFMAACNTECADTVRKAKRLLEAKGIFPDCKGRNAKFRVNLHAIEKLAAQGPPPPRKAPKCSPRTEPEREAVMVRLPGTAAEVPIDDACTAAGGHGAKCGCPLHAICATRFVEGEGVSTTLPRTHSGLEASPPREDSPPAAAQNTPASIPEKPITGVELRTILSQACMDTFGRIAVTGPLWDLTAAAIESRDNIPALEAMIREAARDKRMKTGKLKIGVIREFAKEVAADARAAEALPAQAPPRPPVPDAPAKSDAELAEEERQSIERYEAKAREAWAAAKTPAAKTEVRIRYPDVDFEGKG
jgi:hypothetical protein